MIICGDALTELKALAPDQFDCCVTSPPYWGLRDYGMAGQLGLEKTPEEYVAHLVEVSREVKRALRDDGTLWLNLGDSYYNYRPGAGQSLCKQTIANTNQDHPADCPRRANVIDGLKEKDLVGIPWRVAFALRADGWYLRRDIIWHKPNPMPESCKDRPTTAHEYVFLMSKSEKYYYDAEAIAEPAVSTNDHDYTGQGYKAPGQTARKGNRKPSGWDMGPGGHRELIGRCDHTAPEDAFKGKRRTREGEGGQQVHPPGISHDLGGGRFRNSRSVWTIATHAFVGAHFATMPEELARRCVLAGSRRGGVVLDPFAGAGTTGVVAKEAGRGFLGIEIKKEYVEMAERRISQAGYQPKLEGGF